MIPHSIMAQIILKENIVSQFSRVTGMQYYRVFDRVHRTSTFPVNNQKSAIIVINCV